MVSASLWRWACSFDPWWSVEALAGWLKRFGGCLEGRNNFRERRAPSCEWGQLGGRENLGMGGVTFSQNFYLGTWNIRFWSTSPWVQSCEWESVWQCSRKCPRVPAIACWVPDPQIFCGGWESPPHLRASAVCLSSSLCSFPNSSPALHTCQEESTGQVLLEMESKIMILSGSWAGGMGCVWVLACRRWKGVAWRRELVVDYID